VAGFCGYTDGSAADPGLCGRAGAALVGSGKRRKAEDTELRDCIRIVILSEVGTSRGEALTQSKDPFSHTGEIGLARNFRDAGVAARTP
jgi:hypothetical protein